MGRFLPRHIWVGSIFSQIFFSLSFKPHFLSFPSSISSPAVRWAEWIVCVPTLMYVALSLDEGDFLSKIEISCIIFMGLSIILGFLMQFFNESYLLSYLFLLSSFLSFFISFVFLYNIQDNILGSKNEVTNRKLSLTYQVKSRKIKLFRLLFLLLPTFPIVYLLAYFQWIDSNITEISFMICDTLSKILFCFSCMSINVEILQLTLAAEMSTNAIQRSFLRYIFHEVRVPLNSISMGTCLLQNSHYLSHDDQETLSLMARASISLSDTVDDVLMLQKIEEGKLTLNYSSFTIHDVINTLLNSLKDMILDNQAHIITDISNEVPGKVIGDKTKVQYILSNILTNALKFSPIGGSIELSVKLHVEDQILLSRQFHLHTCEFINTDNQLQTHILFFSVKDYGPGISEADQKQLFIPYMQVRPGELQQGRGSGIGLAICKELAKLLGGDIKCISTLGLGSTFTVTIPFLATKDFSTPDDGASRRSNSPEENTNEVLPNNNINDRNICDMPYDTSTDSNLGANCQQVLEDNPRSVYIEPVNSMHLETPTNANQKACVRGRFLIVDGDESPTIYNLICNEFLNCRRPLES